MKVSIGCDHGALALKNKVVSHLKERGFEVADFGTYSLDSCDYPDFAGAAAKAVAAGECDRGIVLCTTGIGVSIAANKVKGIRAAAVSDTATARLIREHNNANVIAIGARIVGAELAKDIIKTFLTTDFSGEERHQRRIDLISAVEERFGE